MGRNWCYVVWRSAATPSSAAESFWARQIWVAPSERLSDGVTLVRSRGPLAQLAELRTFKPSQSWLKRLRLPSHSTLRGFRLATFALRVLSQSLSGLARALRNGIKVTVKECWL